MTDGEVGFIVPAGVDDPAHVSGGNVYDRLVRDGLSDAGWRVRAAAVALGDEKDAAHALAALPDDGVVLVDGLVAGRAPDAVVAAARRLRVVVLAHVPTQALDPRSVPSSGERRAFGAARAVIATSHWTRAELVRRGLVDPGLVAVALPGADHAPPSRGTAAGGHLLCVGVVAPHKGHDLLVHALGELADVAWWTCTLAGSTAADPRFTEHVAAAAARAGVADRVGLAGVLTGSELERAYADADLFVAPSRAESYGMAIGDSLGHAVPVVASAVGGIPQAFGGRGGVVLLPPDEPAALALALRRWMLDPSLRTRLKDAAARESAALPRWSETVTAVARALEAVR